MNDEQFDKELATLYQKRKSQFIAPTITLEEGGVKTKTKPKTSMIKLCSIFAVGGLASFGIMALITHLVETPVKPKHVNDTTQQVNLTEIEIARTPEKLVLPKVELPPQPKLAVLKKSNSTLTAIENGISVSKVENVAVNMTQTVTLPQLKEPELSINPIYKVMPKYPQRALNEDQSGRVRFSYEIDHSGSVINIVVVDSEVNKLLQRSAKKALAKWKYNPEDNVNKRYEIIFEFNAGNK